MSPLAATSLSVPEGNTTLTRWQDFDQNWGLPLAVLAKVMAAVWLHYWISILKAMELGWGALHGVAAFPGVFETLNNLLSGASSLVGRLDMTLRRRICGVYCHKIAGYSPLQFPHKRADATERDIRIVSVNPVARYQRALQVGIPNPIQTGQSFDCHDHGNASTGAFHADILPAIDILGKFPASSICSALPNGCYLQSCSRTAGLFLCNRTPEDFVQIDCDYFARIAREIYSSYILRHQDQIARLDFCRRVVPINGVDGPKGQEYSGNSFRKKEFATEGGDDIWSLQINRTQACYELQDGPRRLLDGMWKLGEWDGLTFG
ncbi:hypothetical protein H072_11416 [Dactylellina haptotyla CBS 200.50]|uniref:Uncharacterized protein n=1 Tax=Dactylellina haptotyla (strain CBS 200.50) TaxID=1284197 RepID=S8BIT9_DACHA|nr:hypothetical protein H072_11416 [Dactylellina haptotyla CBS 200.50]